MKTKFVKIDLLNTEIFRKATSKDIKKGNVVFLVGDEKKLYKMTIDEVKYPNDDFKSFVADDGCRYGLYNLWILKDNNELLKQISELENIIENIKLCLE